MKIRRRRKAAPTAASPGLGRAPRGRARTISPCHALTVSRPDRVTQVGAELEGPYGVDDNDFPLLHMGISLVDDLDVMLRNAHAAADASSRRRSMAQAAPLAGVSA